MFVPVIAGGRLGCVGAGDSGRGGSSIESRRTKSEKKTLDAIQFRVRFPIYHTHSLFPSSISPMAIIFAAHWHAPHLYTVNYVVPTGRAPTLLYKTRLYLWFMSTSTPLEERTNPTVGGWCTQVQSRFAWLSWPWHALSHLFAGMTPHRGSSYYPATCNRQHYSYLPFVLTKITLADLLQVAVIPMTITSLWLPVAAR